MLDLTGPKCPCMVQQSMSSKLNPVISDVISLFEQLITLWEHIHDVNPNIANTLDADLKRATMHYKFIEAI